MGTSCKVWLEGRYARSSVVTWAPVKPERASSYISDLTRHREWATNGIVVTPVSDGPIRVGSRFRSVGRQYGKEWPADLEVTEYDPPRSFAFTATGGPLPSPEGDPHRHEFLLTPEDGGTRLELRRCDPAPPSWPSWFWHLVGPLVLRSAVGTRIQTVERLRARLGQLPIEG